MSNDIDLEFRLAHISDLHFSEGTDQSNPNHAHSIRLLMGLETRLAGLNDMDLLIVSGDVSNHGDRQSLITANGWLFKTIPVGNGAYTGLNAPPDRVQVVPGNHDAWNATRYGTLIDRRQKSLENYNFAFPNHRISDQGCYFDWLQKGDCGVYLAFVDSCFLGDTENNEDSPFGTLRYDQAIAKGKLSVRQTETLLEWHDQGMRGSLENPRVPATYIDPGMFASSLKVLVMHHYLFEPPENRSDYFMRVHDRDIVFRNIALSDFDVLLCGHKHSTSFDVHSCGDHFDERACSRYMINYFRRLIGLESLPIQFVDESGRKFSKALTQLTHIIATFVKKSDSIAEGDFADKVFELLKLGLDAPDKLERIVRKYIAEHRGEGASSLEWTELKAIQKRISVGLKPQERKALRAIASSISATAVDLRTRPFLQVMCGSSAKASSVADKRRSYNLYRIRPQQDGWNFVCERYPWRLQEFSSSPFIQHHFFRHKLLSF
jgi:hypothetical protein